jgi:pimeloyl-ACP methyl ester carboxylesterase
MAHHLTLIHGINTRKTPPAWPWVYRAWLTRNHPVVSATAQHYVAGPVPPWNIWVTNPREADTLAHYVRLVAPNATDEPAEAANFKHSIVAHSNGACIAVLLAQKLAAQGIRTHKLILVGAAIHSDVERSGLEDLLARGFLDQVICYCTPDDKVVRRLQLVPGFYGSLGSRGFERNGQPHGLRLQGYETPANSDFSYSKSKYITRWFPHWAHSQWWVVYNEEDTFRCISNDLRLPPAPTPK